MNALIIPFAPRRDRKRSVTDFSNPATPPNDLVMDHVDTAPCEYALSSVMPGLVPGIHASTVFRTEDVDGRVKPGHDVPNA